MVTMISPINLGSSLTRHTAARNGASTTAETIPSSACCDGSSPYVPHALPFQGIVTSNPVGWQHGHR